MKFRSEVKVVRTACLCPSSVPMCLCKRTEGRNEFRGQLTEASQASVPSCSDSDSEFGPAGPQTGTNDAPVLEAAAPSVVPLGGSDTPAPPHKTEDSPSAAQQDTPKAFIPASDSFINSLVSDRDKTSTPQLSVTEEPEEPSPAPVLLMPDAVGHSVPWMNVDLEGAEVTRVTQAAGQPPGGAAVAAANYALGTLESTQGVGEEEGPVWSWISGGGCDVDADSQISWLSPTGTWTTSLCPNMVRLGFKCAEIKVTSCLWLSASGPLKSSLSLTPVQSTAWSEQQQQQQEHREEISRKPLEKSNVRPLQFPRGRKWFCYVSSRVMFSTCAPLQSVWVRKDSLRWWRDWKPQRWLDVGVALEQSTRSDGRKDSIFFVYYMQYDERKVGFAVKLRSLKLSPTALR